MGKKKSHRVWVLWCGFVDGKPARTFSEDRFGQYGEGLFSTKKKAKQGYQDVRRVEIREVTR